MLKFYSALFCAVLLNTTGQILLKYGANTLECTPFRFLRFCSGFIHNVYILAGLLCYGVSVILWVIGLTRIDVTVAYPLLSIGYILITLAGYYLFQEPLSILRLAGIAIIMVGVIMVAHSASS